VRFLYLHHDDGVIAWKKAAETQGSRFYVLDRPNPIGRATFVEGPMAGCGQDCLHGLLFLWPVRYGLTIGELAQFFNAENHINCDLHVIPMKNWHRNYFFESTGARWIPPSPSLRTFEGRGPIPRD